MRPILWSFVLFLIVLVDAEAQKHKLDSLSVRLDQTENQRDKGLILHQLATHSWDFNFETGLQYAQKSYAIAVQLDDRELQTIASTDIGLYYYFVGNYDESKRSFRKAIQISGTTSFGEYPSYTFTRLGNLYRVQGQYDSARFFYQQGLALLANKTSSWAESSVYHNLAWLHYELSEYKEALSEMQKSLRVRKTLGDSLMIAECWKFFGMTHRAMANFDSSTFYLSKVGRIAKKFNNPELTIFYYINIGELEFDKGELVKAIKFYELALDLLKEHRFKRYEALTLKKIAEVYYQLNDCERAQQHFISALAIEEELNSVHEKARTYSNMGWCYTDQKAFSLGKQYAELSLALMKEVKDRVGVAFVHNLMGTLALRQREFKTALLYFDSALIVRKEFNLLVYEASTLENKGYVYEAKGDFDSMRIVEEESIKIYKRIGNQVRLSHAYNNLGNLLIRLNDFDEAGHYYQQAQRIALNINFLPELKSSYLGLAKVKQALGSHKEANSYFEKYIQVSDSLHRVESSGKAAQVNALYELEKKEQKIRDLDFENLRKQDELNLKEVTLRNRTLLLAFVSVGIILLTILSLVLYKYYVSKKKANSYLHFLNREINEQKEEIQTQSEELTEANNALSSLNEDLIRKQQEISHQSDELYAANQNLAQLNETLEKKVEERTNELKQAYTELDTFFYRSSHDFRRPLTTFMGLAEVAKVTVNDPNAISLFDKVRETAVSLDKMLMKLQSISDVGLQQLVYKEVHLKEFIETILEVHTYDINQRAIHVSVDLQKTELVSYPALLKIVIENLLENAVFFSRPGKPQIFIRTRQRLDEFVFEIEDNGQGIDPEYQSRIFDMYFRANLGSKGNGLGLYIVKKAVQKLGGKISFTSQFSKGSCFTVRLPAL